MHLHNLKEITINQESRTLNRCRDQTHTNTAYSKYYDCYWALKIYYPSTVLWISKLATFIIFLLRSNCDIAANTTFCKSAGQPFPKNCQQFLDNTGRLSEFGDQKYLCSTGLATSRKSTLKTNFNLNLSTFTGKNPQR